MKQQWVDTLQLEKLPNMEYFPASSALFTIIRIPQHILFSADHLDELLCYIEQHGYTLNGDILGVYLGTVQESGEAYRYMEVWAPVTTAEPSNGRDLRDTEETFLPLRQVFY